MPEARKPQIVLHHLINVQRDQKVELVALVFALGIHDAVVSLKTS